ncbi:hypothetical protein HK102_006230 [Quaeritorhiza haematococci]|nr:hypothetical protein HK102_006230 [Quaeritorhiza haematococci]
MKKTKAAPMMVTFDEAARREFVTGFRKRKLQRKQKAQAVRQEKEKEEKRHAKSEKRKNLWALIRSEVESIDSISKGTSSVDGASGIPSKIVSVKAPPPQEEPKKEFATKSSSSSWKVEPASDSPSPPPKSKKASATSAKSSKASSTAVAGKIVKRKAKRL